MAFAQQQLQRSGDPGDEKDIGTNRGESYRRPQLPAVAMGDLTLKDVEYSFLQKSTSLKNCRCIMDWALVEVREDRVETQDGAEGKTFPGTSGGPLLLVKKISRDTSAQTRLKDFNTKAEQMACYDGNDVDTVMSTSVSY